MTPSRLITEITRIKNALNGSITNETLPKNSLNAKFLTKLSPPKSTLHAGIAQNTEPTATNKVNTAVLNFLLKIPATNPLINRVSNPIKKLFINSPP